MYQQTTIMEYVQKICNLACGAQTKSMTPIRLFRFFDVKLHYPQDQGTIAFFLISDTSKQISTIIAHEVVL